MFNGEVFKRTIRLHGSSLALSDVQEVEEGEETEAQGGGGGEEGRRQERGG